MSLYRKPIRLYDGSRTEGKSPKPPRPVNPEPGSDPLEIPFEFEEYGEPNEPELPFIDDAQWEVFVADDDDRDRLPEPGDFWIDVPESMWSGAVAASTE